MVGRSFHRVDLPMKLPHIGLCQVSCVLGIVAGICRSTLAQPGALDPAFRPPLDLPGGGTVRAFEPDGAGRIWVATDAAVSRLRADGSLDPEFSVVEVQGVVRAFASGPGGAMYVAGGIREVAGMACDGIVRLREDGTVDPGFRAEVGEPRADIQSMAVLPDGSVVVGDLAFRSWGGRSATSLIRYGPDGEVDWGFAEAAARYWMGGTGSTIGVELLPNGRLGLGGTTEMDLATGTTESYESVSRRWIGIWGSASGGGVVRVEWLGPEASRLVGTGVPGGPVPKVDVGLELDSVIHALAVLADGRMLVGGLFTTMNGQWQNHLARLNADGSVDAGFVSEVERGLAPVRDPLRGNVVMRIVPLPGGDVLIGGAFGTVGSTQVPGLARLKGGEAVAKLPEIGPGLTQVKGREGEPLVLAFPVRSASAFVSEWTRDGALVAGADRPVLEIRNLRRGDAGRYVLRVTNAQGEAMSAVIAVDVEPAPRQPGAVDATFYAGDGVVRTNGVRDVVTVDQVQTVEGGIHVAGGFLEFDGHASAYVARLMDDGSVDRAFMLVKSAWEGVPEPRVVVMGGAGEGRILVQATATRRSNPLGPPVRRTVMVRRDGSVDPGFVLSPGITDFTGQTLPAFGGRFVLGGLVKQGMEPPVRVSRWNPDGSRDASFVPFVSGTLNVQAMAWQSGERLLVLFGEELRRFRPDGTLDDTFRLGIALPTQTTLMLVDGQGRVVLGRSSLGDMAGDRPRLLRLLPDGAIDESFRAALESDESPTALALLPDGRIVAVLRKDAGEARVGTVVEVFRDDGSRDPDFQFEAAFRSYPAITSVGVTGSGQMLMGGWFDGAIPGRRHVAAVHVMPEDRWYLPRVTGGVFESRFYPRVGGRYRIESSSTPTGGWTTVRELEGQRAPWTLSEPAEGGGFYRVRILE